MPQVFNAKDLTFQPRKGAPPAFQWQTSERLHDVVGSKRITKLDVRSLDPGKFSFPYHFHRAAEELFVILSGEATLRTPEGRRKIGAGDIVFMEEGAEGAHQLYNHGNAPCVYVDVNVASGQDVVEYPDSKKIGTGGAYYRTATAVDYWDGENEPAKRWPAEVVGEDASKQSRSK